MEEKKQKKPTLVSGIFVKPGARSFRLPVRRHLHTLDLRTIAIIMEVYVTPALCKLPLPHMPFSLFFSFWNFYFLLSTRKLYARAKHLELAELNGTDLKKNGKRIDAVFSTKKPVYLPACPFLLKCVFFFFFFFEETSELKKKRRKEPELITRLTPAYNVLSWSYFSRPSLFVKLL